MNRMCLIRLPHSIGPIFYLFVCGYDNLSVRFQWKSGIIRIDQIGVRRHFYGSYHFNGQGRKRQIIPMF